MNNENNFTIDGVEYVTVDSVIFCGGCSFRGGQDCYRKGVPSCCPEIRTDGREVIFKVKLSEEKQ